MSVKYTLEKAVTKKSFQHFQGNPLYTGNTNCHRRTLQFFLWCRRMTNRTLCFREYTFSIAITALNATNGTKRKLQSVERRSKRGPPPSQWFQNANSAWPQSDCPARIIIKETFMLEGYRHVINK